MTKLPGNLLKYLGLIILLFSLSGAASIVDPDTTPGAISHDELEHKITNLMKTSQPFSLNIYFDDDSALIKPEYIDLFTHLNSLLNDKLTLLIAGHTDSRASNAYNFSLGERRANSVNKTLIELLNNNFLVAKLTSEGEEQPIESNDTPLGQAYNRRVSIKFSLPELVKPLDNLIKFSKQNNSILINEGNQLVLWNALEHCPQNIYSQDNVQIYASDISKDGRLALSGGSDKILTLWDIATASTLTKLIGHKSAISATSFSSFNRSAISGSLDSEVKIWDFINEKEIITLQGHSNKITSVAMSENGNFAASADTQGLIILWNMLNFKEVARKQAHDNTVTKLLFTNNSKYLISSGNDSQLHVWQLDNNETHYLTSKNKSVIHSFDLSNDNQKILSAYANGQIIQWGIQTKEILLNIEKADTAFTSSFYLKEDDVIMASDANNHMHFWDASNGNYMEHFATAQWQSPPLTSEHAPDKSLAWLEPNSQITFSWVPKACFVMGCGPWDQQCSESEQPLHKVCNTGYWLAQHEVNQQQWTQIMGYNPSKCENDECDAQAVNQVSWIDSQLFLCKLNLKSGQIFSLPTESQWEYACRDGGKKISYQGGDENLNKTRNIPNTDNNSVDFGFEYAKEIDKKPAGSESSQFNLKNMNTGVWEWVQDAYSDSSYAIHKHQQTIYSGDDSYHFSQGKVERVARGGAWDKGSQQGQCSTRHYDEPESRTFFTGFRIVKPK